MSVWGNMLDRGVGETVRKEDLEERFKKRLDSEVKKYIEGYVDLMFQYGCTVEEIKHCYQVVLKYLDAEGIVEKLDEETQDLFWDMDEEWHLSHYTNNAIKHCGEDIFLSLKDGDVREVGRKEGDKPIDYKELRDVLKYQVEEVLNRYSPMPGDIPIIDDLDDRTLGVFRYIYDEIVGDTKLKSLLRERNIDDTVERTVERLVTLLSKHDGTNIPPPYDDIDDWWGDFNGTIRYLVWNYRDEIESEREWAQRYNN